MEIAKQSIQASNLKIGHLQYPANTKLIIDRDSKKTHRYENWGHITYNFKSDLFSANIKNRHAEIIPESPLAVYWMVVAPCNLRCVHCYGNVEEFPRERLNTEDQLKIADRIIESGAMRVTLAGGEPLLRKDTPEMIEKLADSHVSVVLGTNGTYLQPSIMNSIRRTNLVEISFDSHDERINNAIRISRDPKGNAYFEALKAIDLCLNSHVRLRVLTCLNKYNFKSLEATADFLYERGVRDWGLSWTVNAGRAKSIYFSHLPPDAERDSVLDTVTKIKMKYPDMAIKYSNRTNVSENNRFSFLIFPDGRAFAEDLALGQKFGFHSLLNGPLVESWTESNFNIKQHFKRWTGERVEYGSEGYHA